MFDRTVFFRLVRWVRTLGELRSKSPIVEPIHPLSERDRAKKDYGKVESLNKQKLRISAEIAEFWYWPRAFAGLFFC